MATHKWMLYVRGGKHNPDISAVVSRVEVGSSGFRSLSGRIFLFQVELHPSYSPHHLVEISTPPFHLTRRGWGEIFQLLLATHCYFCMQHLLYVFLAYNIVFFIFFSSFFFCLQHIQFVSFQLRDAKSYFSLALITLTLFVHLQKHTHKKEHLFCTGEFPLKLKIHFHHPEDRPLSMEHQVKH